MIFGNLKTKKKQQNDARIDPKTIERPFENRPTHDAGKQRNYYPTYSKLLDVGSILEPVAFFETSGGGLERFSSLGHPWSDVLNFLENARATLHQMSKSTEQHLDTS